MNYKDPRWKLCVLCCGVSLSRYVMFLLLSVISQGRAPESITYFRNISTFDMFEAHSLKCPALTCVRLCVPHSLVFPT
jgi:hypothetical protein